MTGNPEETPRWNGIPENNNVSGWHMLRHSSPSRNRQNGGDGRAYAALWISGCQSWGLDEPEAVAACTTYHGPLAVDFEIPEDELREKEKEWNLKNNSASKQILEEEQKWSRLPERLKRPPGL